MPTIQYSARIRKNTGLAISPDELMAIYLHGVDIQARDGSSLSDENLRFYIEAAQREIEQYLEIRFKQTFIEETLNYYREDYYTKFPIIRVKLPIKRPLSLYGMLQDLEQIRFPQAWLVAKKDSEEHFSKTLRLVPTGSTNTTALNQRGILTGTTAYLGLTRYQEIPQYFDFQYVTGFAEIPIELVHLVGKLAALNVFNIAGDLIIGAGIAQQSLSIDGLSQNINTTATSTSGGYGARIIQYTKEIQASINRFKAQYKGINMSVL